MLSVWSDKSEFLALFLWLVMYGLVHTLSLVLDFYFFNNHFSVTTLGLYLFLGTYLTNYSCVVSSD